MALTRREFLKWSGTAGAAAAAMCLGFDLRPVKSYAAEFEDPQSQGNHHHLSILCSGVRHHRPHQKKRQAPQHRRRS